MDCVVELGDGHRLGQNIADAPGGEACADCRRDLGTDRQNRNTGRKRGEHVEQSAIGQVQVGNDQRRRFCPHRHAARCEVGAGGQFDIQQGDGFAEVQAADVIVFN